MIIVMQPHAQEASIEGVVQLIRAHGLSEHLSRGAERTIIGAVGDERILDIRELQDLPEVERAIRIVEDWRIISREAKAASTIITVRGHSIGDNGCQLISPYGSNNMSHITYADPFFVPARPYLAPVISEEQQIATMQDAIHDAHQHNRAMIIRIRDVRQIQSALKAEADILYLGGELMANRALQHEVGLLNVPVIVCKDKHHLPEDWLIAAEHIALKGNHHIILGESGTLSLDPHAPHRLDTEAICKAKTISHLPVIANILRLPHRYMSTDILARLAQAAGADGIISK